MAPLSTPILMTIIVSCTQLIDARVWFVVRSGAESDASVFAANDIVTLDHGGYAEASAAVFHTPLDSNDFAQRTDKNLAAMSDFGRQGECDIELRPGFEILIENEIQATRGNVSSFAFLRVGQALGWDANDYRQRQVITSCGTTFRHYTHPPLRPRSRWMRPRPFPKVYQRRIRIKPNSRAETTSLSFLLTTAHNRETNNFICRFVRISPKMARTPSPGIHI